MPQLIVPAITAIGSFLGSTAFAVGTYAVTWGTILKTTVSAISLISALGKKAPEAIGAPGRNLTVDLDANAPRQVVYGRAALAGHRSFADCYAENQKMGFVYSLSQGECVGLHSVILDDTTVTLSGTQVSTAPWTNLVRFQTENGASSAAAFSSLVSASPFYTTAMRGRGIAKVFMEVDYDEDMLAGGFPQALFIWDGVKVYDPRKDGTRGGTGAHRIDDPATWDGAGYDNPALQALHYIHGIFQGGQKVFGLGVPASMIDFAAFAAAANVCDAVVSGAKRYTSGGVVRDNDDREGVLAAFGAAMGGAVWESAGLFTCYAGAAQASVMTLTDADLAGGIEFLPTSPFRAKVNTLRGKFTDPARDWRANSTAPVTSAAYVTEDGDEIISDEHAVMLATSAAVIHRLTRLELANRREPRTYRARWKPKTAILSEGDCVTVNSGELGVNEKARVIEFALDQDGFAQMTLRTETDAKYTAADDFTQDMPTFERINRYDPRETITPVAGDWSVAAATVSEGESTLPTLEVSGGVANKLVGSVIVEYRRAGDSGWTVWNEGRRRDAMAFSITGVAANTEYEVAVSYRNASGVLGGRTVIGQAVTGVLVSNDVVAVAGTPAADLLADVAESLTGARDLIAALDAEAETALAAGQALLDALAEPGSSAADLSSVLAEEKARLNTRADQANVRTERLENPSGNLIFDPQLALGPADWRQTPGVQPFTRETAQGRALFIRSGAAGSGVAVRAIYKQRKAAIAGERIEVGVEADAAGVAGSPVLELVSYDSGGTAISTQTLALSTGFVRSTDFFDLPTNTAEIELAVRFTSTSAGVVEGFIRRPLWRRAEPGQTAATEYSTTQPEALGRLVEERIASAREVSRATRLLLQNRDLRAKYDELVISQVDGGSALVTRIETLESSNATLSASINSLATTVATGNLGQARQIDQLRVSTNSANAIPNSNLILGPDNWTGSPTPPRVALEDGKRALVWNGPAAGAGQVARWRLDTAFPVRGGQKLEASAAFKVSGVASVALRVVWFDADMVEGDTVEADTGSPASFARLGDYDLTAPTSARYAKLEITVTASGAGAGRALATEFILTAPLEGQSALTAYTPQINSAREAVAISGRQASARQASFERHLVFQAVGARLAISQEAVAREAQDGVLGQLITTLDGAYKTADAALQTQVDARATNTRVDTVEAGAASSLSSTATAIRAELAAADAALQTDINSRATAAALTQAVSDAASARASQATTLRAEFAAADATLQTDIDTKATIASLNTAVSDAASARASLGTTIRAEFAAADATLQTDINTRATVTQLNTAVSDAAGARATLGAAIRAEFAAADAGLQTQVNTKASVTYVNEAVGDEESARATAVAALDAAYKAADATLQTQVNARATTTYVDSAIATEASSRASAIAAQETAYEAADAALQTDVNTRATTTALNQAVSDATSARAALLTQITAAYEAADASLQTQVNTKATVTQLNDAVATEAGARASADTTLQTNINGVSSTATSALSIANTANGKLTGRWGVVFDLDGRVTSAALFDDGTTRAFNLAVDVFTVEGVQPFSYDSVSGVLSAPNLVATNIDADTITVDQIVSGSFGERKVAYDEEFAFCNYTSGTRTGQPSEFNTLELTIVTTGNVEPGDQVEIRGSHRLETVFNAFSLLTWRHRVVIGGAGPTAFEGASSISQGRWAPEFLSVAGNTDNLNSHGPGNIAERGQVVLRVTVPDVAPFNEPGGHPLRAVYTIEPWDSDRPDGRVCHVAGGATLYSSANVFLRDTTLEVDVNRAGPFNS